MNPELTPEEARKRLLLPADAERPDRPVQAPKLPTRGKSVHDIEQMARAEAKRARKRRARQKHLQHPAHRR